MNYGLIFQKPTSLKPLGGITTALMKVCSDRVDIGKGVAYCYYCIEEVKAENPGIKVADARRLAALNAKTTNNKPSTRLGCKTCNMHVCGRHWDDHGKND